MSEIEKTYEAIRRANESGDTDAVKALHGYLTSLKTQPTDTKQPGWTQDKIVSASKETNPMRYAEGFAGGVNVGLGLPVDIINAGLSVIGLGQEAPVGGSQWMRNIGLVPDPPENPLGRGIQRVGEEVGASALPAGALLRAAKRAPNIARTGGFWKDLWHEKILQPIQRAPGTASVGEVAAATGAGTGAAIARETLPESKAAETWGQVAGGFIPSILPAVLLARGGQKLWSRFSPEAQTKAGRKAVEDMMGETLTPEMRRRLAEGEQLAEKMPGFKPSIAEATDSPALLAQQRAVEQNATKVALEGLVARRRNAEQAIRAFSQRKAPDTDVNLEYVIDIAQGRMELFGEKATQIAGKNLVKQKTLAEKLPDVDRIQAGQKIREAIQQAKTEASLAMNLRAEELGINNADFTAPFKEWRSSILQKYKPKSRFETTDPPDIFKQIKGDKAESVTFQDVKAIRERVSDELIDTIGAAYPNRKKVRFLTRLKKDVDDLIDNFGEELGENYTQFRREYFENYVVPFEQGAIFKARTKDGTGFYKARDEVIAETFLSNESAARQYREIFSDDPVMMSRLKSAALDDLRQTAVQDGILDPRKMQSWKKKHQRVLKELPEIEGSVNDVEAAQLALIDRQSQLASRRMKVERQSFAKQLEKYSRDEVAPEKILTDAIKSPKIMGELRGRVSKNPEAIAGLKKAVWDRAVNQGSAQDVVNFMNENGRSLRVVFGKEHFDALYDIATAKSMVEKLPMPGGKADIPRPGQDVEKMIGQGIPQLGSRLFAWKSGRMQKGYLLTDTVLRGLRGRAASTAEDLWRSALYDGKLAKEMADAVRMGTVTTAKARRLYARMFALGIPYVRSESEEQQ